MCKDKSDIELCNTLHRIEERLNQIERDLSFWSEDSEMEDFLLEERGHIRSERSRILEREYMKYGLQS
jgi:hypothetical protein